VKFPFRARGICLFLLPFAFLSAASGQDSPIVRGPFGKPVGVYDEGGNLTIPITVYEDSRVEILISDITGEGWTQWHIDQYRVEGKYWVILYSFFKGKGHCLKTVGGSAQSGCVDYARYEKQTVVVDTKLYTVKFGEVAAYYGERTQPVGFEREPSGSYAITSLDPSLAKAINKISAIVKYQLNSYTGSTGKPSNISEAEYEQAYRKADADAEASRRAADDALASRQAAENAAFRKSYAEAVTFRKAAEQGDANAQFNLGNAYDHGPLPLDFAQAAFWYRKAAEQGNANAQHNLGVLYDLGLGVPQDYAEAYFWYEVAASGKLDITQPGYTSASRLSSEVIPQAQERARKWAEDHLAKP
jgi:hypothetical protein